jgi:energy-coupling factor transporter ATP-binding protein EcfA2
MAFGLLHNLYKHLQSKYEKKLTLVCLGLDNAGKTTTINTLNGLLEEEATPTFGFQAQHLTEGRFKVRRAGPRHAWGWHGVACRTCMGIEPSLALPRWRYST